MDISSVIIVSVSRVNDPSPLTHDIQLFQQKTPSPWKTSNPVVCSNTYSLTHSYPIGEKKNSPVGSQLPSPASLHFSFRVIFFSLPSLSVPFLTLPTVYSYNPPHSLCSAGFASKGRKEGEVAKMVMYCKHAMCIYIYIYIHMRLTRCSRVPGKGVGHGV